MKSVVVRFVRAIRHWWVAARHGVGGDMFGWGTLATALVLGFIQHHYGLSVRVSEQAAWWLTPLLNALAALVVSLLSTQ
jgi:hypothetical protein